MENYEKKYKEALETARKINSGEGVAAPPDWTICELIFPELKESKDDKIRKIISGLIYTRPASFFDNGISKEEMLDWLEKQGNKPKKVSIWKHWKDGIAGGAEDEQIFLIKIGRVYSISSCLGCECDYIELSELDKLMLEKQDEQMSKWSEEDKSKVEDIIYFINTAKTHYASTERIDDCVEWLESLKQRMEEQQ